MLLKSLKITLVCALVGLSQFSSAQDLVALVNIRYPKDTVSSRAAAHTLNQFLRTKEGAAKDNGFIWKDELPATSDMLDEMKGMDDFEGPSKEKGYYKCMLTNIIQKDSDNYLFQISYIHPSADYPALRASFTLLAKKVDGKFLIYSPLKQNTEAWKNKSLWQPNLPLQNQF